MPPLLHYWLGLLEEVGPLGEKKEQELIDPKYERLPVINGKDEYVFGISSGMRNAHTVTGYFISTTPDGPPIPNGTHPLEPLKVIATQDVRLALHKPEEVYNMLFPASSQPADLVVERFCYSSKGVFARMKMPDGVVLYTVERPWLNNQPEVSCIPEGSYVCRPRPFYSGGYDAVEVTNVPGRSHILFHVANYPNDVKGCLGVGSDWQGLMVSNSRQAFRLFMEHYGRREFVLKIGHIKEFD